MQRNDISSSSKKQLPLNTDKKSKAGKRIETNELGKRLNLLASKCFKFNESLKQWGNGNRKVDHSFVIDPCISYSQFSEYVDNLFKRPEKSRPKKGNSYIPRPRSNSVNEDQKSSDAMDYRLPGSFGTGKRR
jgi:hypothetical protein